MRKKQIAKPQVKKKRDLQKQEAVVSALWGFAADLQLRPHAGCISTIESGPNAGTKASLDHVVSALEKIMDAFGYETTQLI